MSGYSGDSASSKDSATSGSSARERLTAEWAALSSEHERLVLTAENAADPAWSGTTQWAELASQRERLLEPDAPLGGLVSSSQHTSGLRLVVRAA